MAKFYKTKDKYLWKQGIVPILFWVNIGITGYLLFVILHGPITGIKNIAITLLWGALTLLLTIYWSRKTRDKIESIESYTKGYICEFIARRILMKKLSNEYNLIRSIRFLGLKGNIDLVIVCSYGVFAIEVKSKYILPEHRNQVKRNATNLKKYLIEKGVNINYVEPVLVYILRDKIGQTDNDETVVLGKSELIPYFIKNMPLRNNKKLDNSSIDKIIKILV